jgi:aryl-alcohol dehydrogenase-like predicted oxidoreductase
VEEVLRGLDDLVRAGKVLYIGISDTPAWIAAYAQASAELRGWSHLVAYQGEYNLLERGIERDVLPMSRALDMAVLAFGMLGGGVLTGKFNQPGGPGEPTRARQASEREQAAATAILEVAKELGRSPSQVAINWVRQQSPNIIPILGARRPAQIQDNLGALDFTLSAEHLQRLAAASPLEPGYPHSFWNDFVRRDLIFGEKVDLLDRPY